MTEPENLSTEQLATALHNWAKGLHAAEAAVYLLVNHDYWLRRGGFRASYVSYDEHGFGPGGKTMPIASIDWSLINTDMETGRFALGCSNREYEVLRAACSLAIPNANVSLNELLVGTGQHTVGLVLDAVAHAAGWHDSGYTRHVDGHPRTPGDEQP